MEMPEIFRYIKLHAALSIHPYQHGMTFQKLHSLPDYFSYIIFK